MNRMNKTLIWLLLMVFIIVVFTSLATYAYFSFNEYHYGGFDVEINSKGVDILTFKGSEDVYIKAHVNNFAPVIGHDLNGKATVEVELETTNAEAEYCYEMNLIFPDEVIFEYSDGKTPELLLNVKRSSDGKKYNSIITDMDITQSTGTLKIPVSNNSEEYQNKMYVKKRRRQVDYWSADITLVYLKDIDQTINDNKTYRATFEAKRIECK